MSKPTAKFENQFLEQGYKYVIGCDEVGRGCLAGPVVAAAVVFDTKLLRKGINDSKVLNPEQRSNLDVVIKGRSSWGLGLVEHRVIDRVNIHVASLLAMQQAVENLCSKLDLPVEETAVLVDGRFKIPHLEFNQLAIIDGDAKAVCIAAASIVAKVYRDALMVEQHKKFPQYNFAQHKGYATVEHRRNLEIFGPSKIHRLSFI